MSVLSQAPTLPTVEGMKRVYMHRYRKATKEEPSDTLAMLGNGEKFRLAEGTGDGTMNFG